jgi:phage repressor protein C with HTH and peptisase S24 domain
LVDNLDEGKLLRDWVSNNRSSAYKLAARIGVKAPSVYHQMGLPKLSGSFVEKLEAAGILLFDKEIKDNYNKPKIQSLTPISLDDVLLLNVPLVQEYAYAGYMSGYSDETYLNDLPTIPFIADKQYKGTYMAFQVRGDSMDDGSYNSYLQGDIVLCREVNQSYWKNRLHINKWDFVIVHRTEGILLKKIVFHEPESGLIRVHSLNALYEDMELNLTDVAQLFNVVKVERKK